jgi:peptide/nickel transport system permease protein
MTARPHEATRPTRQRTHASLLAGGAITAAVIAIALVALVWTPYDPTAIVIADRLQPPSSAHWLALLAVVIGIGIGVPFGLIAAARRGWLADAIMRLNDVVFAFPALLLAVMITALAGPGAINAIIAIGIFNVPVFARLTRGAALTLWTRDYVLAARVAGKGATLISLEHILPNVFNTLVVQATIQFSLAILAEAALSYVGLGSQPPTPNWGRMLADAQTLIALAPRLAVVPGLAIVVTVLGLNLLGDGLRDILDPRLRRAR